MSADAWYRNKWVKITAIALAAISVIITIAAVVTVVIWNGRPEKALIDSLDYALRQPGVYTINSTDLDGKLQIDGERYAADINFEGIPLSAVGNANMLYLRTTEPEKILDKIVPKTSLGPFLPSIREVISSVKDKWLSINLQNQALEFPVLGQIYCATDIKDSLSNNSTARRAFAASYIANPFLGMRVTDTNNARSVYELRFDDEKRLAFLHELEGGDFAEGLSLCQDIRLPVLGDTTQASMTVEVTQPIHKLDKLTIKDKTGKVMKITADYSRSPLIVIPSDTVDMDKIANTVVSSMMRSYLQGR